MSRLGFYVRGTGNQADIIRRCRPAVCKIELDGLSVERMRELHDASPDTLWIGRLVNYADVWRLLQAAEPFRGLIDALEGRNEVICQTPDEMRAFAQEEVERTRRLHLSGWRSVVGNFATGNPELHLWRHFAAALDDADYLGLHEYSPALPARAEDWTWHQGRFARVYEQLSRRVPLIITECGIDDGRGGGWTRHGSATQYLDYLREYDAFLQRSGLPVIGATIFCYGRFPSDEWGSFDVSDMADELAAYIAGGREVEQMTELNQNELLDLCTAEIGAGWQDIRAALPRHATLRWGKRALSAIDTVVAHWSATSTQTSTTTLANYHIAGDTARDLPPAPGIRYHVVVYPWVARLCVNLDEVVGHCGNEEWNRRSVGLCFVTNARPTTEALALAEKFISCLARWSGRDLNVIGHRDVPGANTECPGPTWREWMPDLQRAGQRQGVVPEARIAELERQVAALIAECAALQAKINRAREVLSS